MKYMLMMNTPGGGPYQIGRWPAEDIKAHIAFMKSFARKLRESGELAAAEGLFGPDRCAPPGARRASRSETTSSRTRPG